MPGWSRCQRRGELTAMLRTVLPYLLLGRLFCRASGIPAECTTMGTFLRYRLAQICFVVGFIA